MVSRFRNRTITVASVESWSESHREPVKNFSQKSLRSGETTYENDLGTWEKNKIHVGGFKTKLQVSLADNVANRLIEAIRDKGEFIK